MDSEPHQEGRRQGYLDGFCGSYFDDSLPRTMRRRPLEFVEGYAQAYTTAYDINFERGKQARRNSYRRSRARRWHCWY